ncbi:MAG TPA: hypothetical protein VLA96_05710 [Terriglobales bacterium]|nr:hypothetical protein [Terriglobales bacterium]
MKKATLLAMVLWVVSAWAAEPCCSITSIDQATGRVTAVVKQTGRRFTFEVKNAQTLAGLKVGQGIYANLTGKQVSLDGKSACCRIIAIAEPAEPVGSAASSATAQKKSGEKIASTSADTTKGKAEETSSTAGATRGRPESEAEEQAEAARPAPSEAQAATMQEGEDEDDGEPPDPKPARAALVKPKGVTGRAGGKDTKKLSEVPYADKILKEVMRGLKDREIDVALIRGEKYMINKCLGIKASTGTFALKLENPDLRLDGSGVKMTLNIPRIAMHALKVRIRPNTNLMKNPCSFSKRHKVGGTAKDVKLVMRFDPVLDMQQCQLGGVGKPEIKWRIGELNLKPLQNDLDKIAKNMIEDALTNASNFNLMDRTTAAFNAAIGAECKK